MEKLVESVESVEDECVDYIVDMLKGIWERRTSTPPARVDGETVREIINDVLHFLSEVYPGRDVFLLAPRGGHPLHDSIMLSPKDLWPEPEEALAKERELWDGLRAVVDKHATADGPFRVVCADVLQDTVKVIAQHQLRGGWCDWFDVQGWTEDIAPRLEGEYAELRKQLGV